MGRSSVHSVAVATGAMATSGGYPDPGAMTWAALRTQRGFADFFSNGADPIADVDLTGADPNDNSPPVAANPVNLSGGALFGAANGEAIRRLISDGIGLRVPWYNVDGVTFATHMDHPLFQIMRSGMQYETPGAANDTIAAVPANAYTHTPTTAGDYFVGECLAYVRNGIVEYTFVTDVDAVTPLITVSPEWPGGAVANGGTIIHCTTFSRQSGSVAGTDFVHLRFDSGGLRRYAFNCVLSEWSLTVEGDDQNSGGGTLFADVTIRPGARTILTDNSAAATLAYTPAGTSVATPLQSCRWKSDAVTSTATTPAHLAASEWGVRSFTPKVVIGMEGDGGCGALLPESGVTIGQSLATIEYQDVATGAEDRSIIDGEEYQYVIGYGPSEDGLCFALQSGHLQSTETYEETEGKVQLVNGTLRNGSWSYDDGANDTADTGWRIGVPMPQ